MGRLIVTLLATLFICGVFAAFVPSTQGLAFGNSHGVTWMMLIGVCTFIGSWKMVSGK